MPDRPLIVIPARLAATRLPGKPLEMINGYPMIAHVAARALEARVGPVVVAAAEAAIAKAVAGADFAALVGGGPSPGAVAVELTDPDLPSGSDRVWAAVCKYDPDAVHDVIINLQGDMPTIDPAVIKDVLAPLADAAVDIATLVAPIRDPAERDDPNVVKAILDLAPGARIGRALDFTREPATGPGPHWHHIGIYAYRRAALERFVGLAQSARERAARLEQLRALDAGMRIDAAVVDTVPLGVDTPADLERARALLQPRT
ncbi:MAG TPA: 3-deoxy-manno-octulosonate cytidylyltransferase [Alphaproteobacteria bacterium]